MKALALSVLDLKVLVTKLKNNLGSIELATCNMSVANAAISCGFKKISLIGLDKPKVGNSRSYQHNEAEKLSRLLDSEIAFHISQELGLDFLPLGWMHLNLYCLVYTGIRLKWIATELAGRTQGQPIFIHSPQNEPYFYLDSWFTKEIVASTLNETNKIIKISSDGLTQKFQPDFDYNLTKYDFENIGHFPTIFYEKDKLNDVISNTKNMIQLPSQFWDVWNGGQQASLEIKPQAHNESSANEKIFKTTKKLFDFFGVTDTRLNSTAEYYNRHINSQILLYKQLNECNSIKRIKSVSVSDHDTSITGPILSFAMSKDIPVNIYAHSLIPMGPLADTKQTVRHNLICENNLSISIAGNLSQREVAISKISNDQSAKKILLLFNAFDDFSGVITENYFEMNKAVNDLISHLNNNGHETAARFKPHFDYSNLFKIKCPKAEGPLEKFINWPDIAISFGQTTTALVHFAQIDKATFHVQSLPLIEPEIAMLHPSTKTIISDSWITIITELKHAISMRTQAIKGEA